MAHVTRRCVRACLIRIAETSCDIGWCRRCDCGVVGVREGSGDAVLVPAAAFVYDRVFEAVLISIESSGRARLASLGIRCA